MTSTGLLGWGSLIVLAVLARRNLRLGRADRTGARRLAVGATVAQTLSAVGRPHALRRRGRRSAAGPVLWSARVAVLRWFEPAMRRTWPRLLIASIRLLDGRWRDPLVGRAVLPGVLVGLAVALPWSLALTRLLDLPGGGPTDVPFVLPVGGLAAFVGDLVFTLAWTLQVTLLVVGILLVVRLLARRTDVTVMIVVALFVGWNYTMLLGVDRPASVRGCCSCPSRCTASCSCGCSGERSARILYQPGSSPASRVMRPGHSTCPVGTRGGNGASWRPRALAVWGFRNVLGRQSAFPTGALDG